MISTKEPEKLKIKTCLNHKATNYEPSECVVEKIITLPTEDFQHLLNEPLDDYNFIKEKGEHSGVIVITEPIAVLTPEKENVRQQGRRFKLPGEPMFTITVTDKHGVVYCGYIRKLMPIEAWRLQGFTDEQFHKVQAIGMSDAQLYKQAGNAVTTTVVEAVARFILDVEKECT